MLFASGIFSRKSFFPPVLGDGKLESSCFTDVDPSKKPEFAISCELKTKFTDKNPKNSNKGIRFTKKTFPRKSCTASL